MGYDVEITRDPFSRREGKGPRIHLEEWYDVVRQDQELYFELPAEPGRYPPLSVCWVAHPNADSEKASTRLHYSSGIITVKYPDDPMLRKMVELGMRLKALVVGDNGELYQLNGAGELVSHDGAIPDAPEPALYGLGASFCRDLTAMVAANPVLGAIPHHTWYLGFLTSFNQARYNSGQAVVNYPLTEERIAEDKAFLRAYSAEHPDNRVVQAVLALIRMHDLRLNP